MIMYKIIRHPSQRGTDSASLLPSTGQENNIVQPKTGKWFSFPFHHQVFLVLFCLFFNRFSRFNCCWSVVIVASQRGVTPKICRLCLVLINWIAFFWTFCVFGSCFRASSHSCSRLSFSFPSSFASLCKRLFLLLLYGSGGGGAGGAGGGRLTER